MSDIWSSTITLEWLQRCKETHEQYYTLIGNYNWLEYKQNEYELLKRNIGYAFFRDESNEFTGYSENQLRSINKIFKLIEKSKKEHQNRTHIWVSFLLVCCKSDEKEGELVVIRVPKYDVTSTRNQDMFIDNSFRVYKNWEDFLRNNKLPDCLMCFPRNGKYFQESNELQLDTGVSPEGRTGSKALKFCDILTTAANASVAVASLTAPVALPSLIGK